MLGKEELFSFSLFVLSFSLSLFFFVLFWFFTGISQSRISHWLLQQGSDLSEQKKRAFYRWYQLEKTNPGKQMQPEHLLLFIYRMEAFCLLALIIHFLVWGTPEVLHLTRLIFRRVGRNLLFALQQMMQSCLLQSCLSKVVCPDLSVQLLSHRYLPCPPTTH